MINLDCPLILRDLYSYDIRSAYASILETQNFDFEGIDLENKEERSIFLGKKQIQHRDLSSYLMNSAEQLVNFYLNDNDVDEQDIIVTQRDGFILTRMLHNNSEFIEMEMREFIDFLIFSVDRKTYLYLTDGKITIKNVAKRYPALDSIYEMFADLNFYSKKVLFQQLNKIKNAILESTNKELFMIPMGDGKMGVSTFRGDFIITNSSAVSIDSIDRRKYYQSFFEPFLRSIFLTCY